MVAGAFLMFLILVLGDWVVLIPMPVLAGIMIMVCIGTFDWSSFNYLRKAPKSDALVMLATVIIVVATHDLSKGVIAGVILSAIFFVAKMSKLEVRKRMNGDEAVFTVKGQLFFASSNSFVDAFDYSLRSAAIVIDFSAAHIWDDSAVGALDKVIEKYHENGNRVTVTGLDTSSQSMVDRLAVTQGASAKASAH